MAMITDHKSHTNTLFLNPCSDGLHPHAQVEHLFALHLVPILASSGVLLGLFLAVTSGSRTGHADRPVQTKRGVVVAGYPNITEDRGLREPGQTELLQLAGGEESA